MKDCHRLEQRYPSHRRLWLWLQHEGTYRWYLGWVPMSELRQQRRYGCHGQTQGAQWPWMQQMSLLTLMMRKLDEIR